MGVYVGVYVVLGEFRNYMGYRVSVKLLLFFMSYIWLGLLSDGLHLLRGLGLRGLDVLLLY